MNCIGSSDGEPRGGYKPDLIEHSAETCGIDEDLRGEIWQGYDPDRVQEALRATAGILRGVDVDALIADLEAQRE